MYGFRASNLELFLNKPDSSWIKQNNKERPSVWNFGLVLNDNIYQI